MERLAASRSNNYMKSSLYQQWIMQQPPHRIHVISWRWTSEVQVTSTFVLPSDCIPSHAELLCNALSNPLSSWLPFSRKDLSYSMYWLPLFFAGKGKIVQGQ